MNIKLKLLYIKNSKMIYKKNIKWHSWTRKSKHIKFKSIIKGVGDGEQKIATELNTKVLGQNSNYDMKVIINGNQNDCDVKKLDNNTFNVGVKGRDIVRPIKNNISSLLNIFKKISGSSILTLDEQNKLSKLVDLSPDELCVSNIIKISDMCYILCKKQEILKLSLPKVYDFKKKEKQIEMTLDEYFNICQILGESISDEYDSYKEILIFLYNISHIYISNPQLFNESLCNLTLIFNEIKLIFVDKIKGYCIWDKIEYINFERITRGHPRFRVCI